MMEKHFHLPDERPREGSVIFTLRGKVAKLEEVSAFNWPIIKLHIDSWAYVTDMVKDLDNLQKYLRAYNYYRDNVKKVCEETTNKFTKQALNDIYTNATNIIRSE